jgi:hypothetical protein
VDVETGLREGLDPSVVIADWAVRERREDEG